MSRPPLEVADIVRAQGIIENTARLKRFLDVKEICAQNQPEHRCE